MGDLPLHNLVENLVVIHDLLLIALLDLVEEHQIVVSVKDLAHQQLGDRLVTDERLVTDLAPYPHQLVLEAGSPQNAIVLFLLDQRIAIVIEIGLAKNTLGVPLFYLKYLFLDNAHRASVAVDSIHASDDKLD